MTASDYSISECGYVTLEVYMDPVFWGGVRKKVSAFSECDFPSEGKGSYWKGWLCIVRYSPQSLSV